MPDIKLGRLPDRTPVKLALKLPPDLHLSLCQYARFYQAEHGEKVVIEELIPAMLASFIAGDRGFTKALRERRLEND
jgi:hypothetical protein